MNTVEVNSTTNKILQFLISLMGIAFVTIGTLFLIFPDLVSMLVFYVIPTNYEGLNTLRGDFGGLFIGMGFFCLISVASKHYLLQVVPLAFLFFIIFGRLVSFSVDDLPHKTIAIVMVESVLFFILLLSVLRNVNMRIINVRVVTGFSIIAAIVVGSVLFQKELGFAVAKLVATKTVERNITSEFPDDALRVVLCGTGAPIADPKRSGPCTAIIAGGKMYIVDTGPGATKRLDIMGLGPHYIEAVFLTHYHSDHIGDLGEMILKRWSTGSSKTQLPIYGPEGIETVVNGFNLAYSQDTHYRIEHHGLKTVPLEGAGGASMPFTFGPNQDTVVLMDKDGLKITAFPVDHPPVSNAVGYRFDYKGRSVVISGDTTKSGSLTKHAEGADLLLHEALQPTLLSYINQSAEEKGRAGIAGITEDILHYHATPEDAAQTAQAANVRHLVFYHIIPPLTFSIMNKAFLGDSKEFYQGPITIGVDGMIFTLPENSELIYQDSLL